MQIPLRSFHHSGLDKLKRTQCPTPPTPHAGVRKWSRVHKPTACMVLGCQKCVISSTILFKWEGSASNGSQNWQVPKLEANSWSLAGSQHCSQLYHDTTWSLPFCCSECLNSLKIRGCGTSENHNQQQSGVPWSDDCQGGASGPQQSQNLRNETINCS